MTESILAQENCFDAIKSAGKPVVLFGMGNGADMIIDVFEKYSIKWEGVFASDKFVRGHSFHSKKVLTLLQAEEIFGDFVAVMTFAVHDDETIGFVKKISEKHQLFSPTVPVAGSGLFTREFAEQNIEKINRVYSLLADERSRKTFENVIKFKISGKLGYLFEVYSPEQEVFDGVLKLSDSETILDLGAYDGDTLRIFLQNTGGKYKKIVALEPDEKNFRKLAKATQDMENVELINKGVWKENTVLRFQKSAGRQSKVSDNADRQIEVIGVDSLKEDFSFIKMDVEGCEREALLGAEKTIKKCLPKLYVCAYHRNEDIFDLPLLINSFDERYKLYFRQHKYIPAWESNFYAVAK